MTVFKKDKKTWRDELLLRDIQDIIKEDIPYAVLLGQLAPLRTLFYVFQRREVTTEKYGADIAQAFEQSLKDPKGKLKHDKWANVWHNLTPLTELSPGAHYIYEGLENNWEGRHKIVHTWISGRTTEGFELNSIQCKYQRHHFFHHIVQHDFSAREDILKKVDESITDPIVKRTLERIVGQHASMWGSEADEKNLKTLKSLAGISKAFSTSFVDRLEFYTMYSMSFLGRNADAGRLDNLLKECWGLMEEKDVSQILDVFESAKLKNSKIENVFPFLQSLSLKKHMEHTLPSGQSHQKPKRF